MLRRSVTFRRLLAVALAGVALGACSNAAEDATAPASPEVALGPTNPLNFSISTSNLFFNFAGGNTPGTQTADVSGLVVTTTPYVRVLSITYSPSYMKDWLRITQRPTMLPNGTLGVRLTFTPRYIDGLEQGATATVPITVPGARNGPQTITVSTNPLNCSVSSNLLYPSQNYLVGNLEYNDCLGRLQGYETAPYLTPFDMYTLTVPGNTTFTVFNRGVASNGGTLYDPYLYLWDPVTNVALDQDDDDGDGFQSPYYDSRIVWSNTSSQPKLYYLLASRCCGGNGPANSGTYSLDIWPGSYYPYGAPPAALSAAVSGGDVVFKSAEEARAYAQMKARGSRRGPQ